MLWNFGSIFWRFKKNVQVLHRGSTKGPIPTVAECWQGCLEKQTDLIVCNQAVNVISHKIYFLYKGFITPLHCYVRRLFHTINHTVVHLNTHYLYLLPT